MKIQGFDQTLLKTMTVPEKKMEPTESFGSVIGELVKNTNADQINSQKSIENFVSGNGVELHEVMLAGEKAKTSLQLLMEIRNKAVDMYKELTRIPI